MIDLTKLKVGLTKTEVEELFGPPDATGGTSRKYKVPCLYLYGHVEIAFAGEKLWYVMDKGEDNTNHRYIYQNGLPTIDWPLDITPNQITKLVCDKMISALKATMLTNEAILLLKPAWRRRNTESGIASTGFCYLAAEALFHLLGTESSIVRPHRASFELHGEKCSHWWLQDSETVLDPTADQFPKGFDYSIGKRAGFLTGYKLSNRSRRFLEIMFSLSTQTNFYPTRLKLNDIQI